MQENAQVNNSPDNVVDKNSTHVFQSKEKDITVEYFSERAKKLTTAVYLVTNLIPQNDPLRIYIRRDSVKLLSFVGRVPSGYSLVEAGVEVRGLSKKIIEMLEIAFFSGYVSEMNYSVLKSEFDSFINEVSSYERFQAPLSPSSLKVDRARGLPQPDNRKTQQISRIVAKKAPVDNSIQRREIGSKSIVEAKKTSRKEAILSIIKRRGTVSIKDVSAVIINCSEKTIQRELMSLVEDGTLKKSGDRRWSVYSLANA